MHYIFNKMKYLIILTIIVLIIFFFFGVFSPLKNQLEESLYKNFEESVSIIEMNVENKLKNYKEGAESLSSRTMIKNKLAEHKAGNLSLEELRVYTQDKYVDGVKILDNIVAAFRISKGNTIASWGEKELIFFSENINYDNQTTELKFLKKDFLIVINS